MNYQTRQLTAKQDIRHGHRLVLSGQRFEAVDVDAQFYLTRNMAAEVPPQVKVQPAAEPAISEPAQPAPSAPPVRRSPGRPSNASRAAIQSAPTPAIATEAPAQD